MLGERLREITQPSLWCPSSVTRDVSSLQKSPVEAFPGFLKMPTPLHVYFASGGTARTLGFSKCQFPSGPWQCQEGGSCIFALCESARESINGTALPMSNFYLKPSNLFHLWIRPDATGQECRVRGQFLHMEGNIRFLPFLQHVILPLKFYYASGKPLSFVLFFEGDLLVQLYPLLSHLRPQPSIV